MTAPQRFELLVFDWDGTLFDSTGLIARCIQAACRDCDVPVPSDADAAYVIGLGLVDAMRHAAPGLPPERYPELGLRYRHHYFASAHEVVLFDGTLPMLHGLKARGHKLAVATGKSRRGLDEALANSQLQGLFEATRTADETRSKPHPLMLEQLMDELATPRARTLMIGDTTHDLQLAANAGVASLGIAHGAHDAELLHRLNPLHVARGTPELHRWLLDHA
ncbi:MAG: HAD-IA family hydrolase [Rubrivivax sp.]|jgi:phosphoglycolate phosphatase|nr:HAD-IA family hydrolase [Rubrivivax sp.]